MTAARRTADRQRTGVEPIAAALQGALAELIRDAVIEAVAELREDERARPALLTAAQLCDQLQVSRATLHRLQLQGLPRVMVIDSPRYVLADVLGWLQARGDGSGPHA